MNKENKSGYPCTDCEEDERICNRQTKYLRCYKWRKWFHEQWELIQKKFARNVSDGHIKKGGDDE